MPAPKQISAMRTFYYLFAALAIAQYATAYKNKIYLIRHGEKPADDNTTGLSSQGEERAQCLRNVFGASSGYNIGFIITQDYKSDGSRVRPYETVEPLANDLGLTIDHHCDRDDTDCAADAINAFAKAAPKSQNILVCWEHDALGEIGAALGGSFDYPSSHFDLIYEIYDQDLTANSPFSENCPGLDS